MSSEYSGPQVVGIDLHRHRSVLVRKTPDGFELGRVRIDNSRENLRAEIAKAGIAPEVVLEATYGWYWAADTLAEAGATVHLAHPLGVKMFALRRVKTDERDAADLADLLRMGRLPESWIAPEPVRVLRELVRYRHKLIGMRTSGKAQIHAVVAKCGLSVPVTDLFGVRGCAWLHSAGVPGVYRLRIVSLLRLIDAIDAEITMLDMELATRLAGDPRYAAIQAIPGVGPTLGAVLIAEIGDVTRFRRPELLCSWAGLTPRHRQSDTKTRRGRISKQGSPLLRWACIEAVQRLPLNNPIRAIQTRILDRRGRQARNVGVVAAARKLLTLVYYGMRDGHIRCLQQEHQDGE